MWARELTTRGFVTMTSKHSLSKLGLLAVAMETGLGSSCLRVMAPAFASSQSHVLFPPSFRVTCGVTSHGNLAENRPKAKKVEWP